MLKEITLNVPQGVGDIFWIYQKFSPYFDKINFQVGRVPCNDNKIAKRSFGFLELLPKTGTISELSMRDSEYHDLVNQRYDIFKILNSHSATNQTFNYACNKPLEEGVRLESIDPDTRVEETVDIKTKYAPLKFPEKEYVAVYISGNEKNNHPLKQNEWGYKNWTKFLQIFFRRYKLKLPIIFVGASYDKVSMDTMSLNCNTIGINNHVYCDSYPANVLYIIKNSKCFIGYQSGLNILADNMDVPQVMLYFPFLEKMQYAWSKQKNINNKTYNCSMFSYTPERVARDLQITL